MTPVRLLASIALCLTCTGFTAAQETNSYTYKQTKQGKLQLKVYRPRDWQAGKQYPAIVFFFGGGWNKGNIEQFDAQAKYLAERGLVAICADYRVKSRHQVAPDACVEDAKSAVRWVRKQAQTLAIHPDKIIAAGGSAGAHIAACTALTPGLDASGEDAAISSRPNLLVLYNPVLNFNVDTLTARLGNDEKLARLLSPTVHLTKSTPATLLLYGKEDRLLVQGEEYLARSKELGHTTEIFLADGVGHSFFNRAPWKERTTQRVDAFLVSQGYLLPKAAESQVQP